MQDASLMQDNIGQVALFTSILLAEMLLSCINQYCVLILNCFIVNNKGGNRKRK